MLGSGAKLIVEEMPGYYSVSIGVWMLCGSRKESRGMSGVSHFIEHMLFKGTRSRSVKAIAQALERVGGRLNAFTGKELTCLHATVLREHFGLAADLLSDLLLNSVFSLEETLKEKSVIIEEINLYEDTPSEHVGDLFARTVFPDHPAGLPISGTRDSVSSIGRDEVLAYYRANYALPEFLIAVAGNVTYKEAEESLNAVFAGSGGLEPRKNRELILGSYPSPDFMPRVKTFKKDFSQAHVCIGFPGPPNDDEERYAFSVFNLVFGGGMSSRLFQKIREDKGLVYAIGSYPVPLIDAGYLVVYAGADGNNLKELVFLVLEEARVMLDEGLEDEELDSAKGNFRGSILLGLESTEGRMARLAVSEIYLGRIVSISEVRSKIDSLSKDDVKRAARRFIDINRVSVVSLGTGPEEEEINSSVERSKRLWK